MEIKKKISILGSTGSIGTQALDIIRENRDIEVIALSGNANLSLLKEQALEFHPKVVAVYSKENADILREELNDTDIKVVAGMEGLVYIASLEEIDIVLTAIVGMIGIEPTIAAICAGKDIALANKETLVCAGHIIMPLAKEKGVRILPVDSEHSAIFQALAGNEGNRIARILLTASGGPFRGYTKKALEDVSLEDALKHPNWSMGKKITIDSSTMVNKALEVIEARWLFDVDFDDIEVLIQPKSIIHSMLEYEDGSVMAQLGTPDMHLPIQYALYYPKRRFLKGERLDFKSISKIDLEEPDMEVFEGLKLGFEAGKAGGSMPAVFNIANEYAVDAFLSKKIRYLDIVSMIRYALSKHQRIDNPSVEDIIALKQEVEKILSTYPIIERK